MAGEKVTRYPTFESVLIMARALALPIPICTVVAVRPNAVHLRAPREGTLLILESGDE